MANYDTTNALTVASAGGIVGTLVGTTIPLLPPYLPVIAVVFALFQKWGLATISAIAAALLSPAFAPPLPALQQSWVELQQLFDLLLAGDWAGLWRTSPIVVAAFALGALISFMTFVGMARRKYFDAAFGKLFYGLIVAALLCPAPLFIEKVYRIPYDLTVVSDVLRRPWIPAEEIRLKNGSLIVGYTLSLKDGWALLLRERDRSVEYMPAAEVVGRSVCAVKTSESRLPLIALRGVTAPSTRQCAAA